MKLSALQTGSLCLQVRVRGDTQLVCQQQGSHQGSREQSKHKSLTPLLTWVDTFFFSVSYLRWCHGCWGHWLTLWDYQAAALSCCACLFSGGRFGFTFVYLVAFVVSSWPTCVSTVLDGSSQLESGYTDRLRCTHVASRTERMSTAKCIQEAFLRRLLVADYLPPILLFSMQTL